MMSRHRTVGMGVAAVIAFTWLWHGPMGAAERFAQAAENEARVQLDRDEMFAVKARFQRHPMTRKIILSGPADDFQRREIVRRMKALPGVGDAAWDPGSLSLEPAR